MTLIKFYSKTTCYDGRKAFSKPSSDKKHLKRHYPDEYLIAHILEKYKNQRTIENREIIVLTESWGGNGDTSIAHGESREDIRPFDEGGANTKGINNRVLEELKKLSSSPADVKEKEGEQDPQKKTLILVPFLYGYHHPGIVIDVSEKHVLYLDPYGHPPHYEMAIDLNNTLESKGFKVSVVRTKQQTDNTSCGPILTASMIQFCEDFFKTGTVSPDVFTSPRPNLATDRIFQIYVNNSPEPKESKKHKPLVEEIMLANFDLWKSFCQQQEVVGLEEQLNDLITHQREYIEQLKDNWESHPLTRKKVEFIRDVQSRIIELIFLKKDNFYEEIIALLKSAKDSLQAAKIESESFITLHRQNLLSSEYIEQTKKILGLSKKPLRNQTESLPPEEEKNRGIWLPTKQSFQYSSDQRKPPVIRSQTENPSTIHTLSKGVAWSGYITAGVTLGMYVIGKAFYPDATDAVLSKQGLGRLSVAETSLIILAIVLTVATVALAVSCHTRPDSSSLLQP